MNLLTPEPILDESVDWACTLLLSNLLALLGAMELKVCVVVEIVERLGEKRGKWCWIVYVNVCICMYI